MGNMLNSVDELPKPSNMVGCDDLYLESLNAKRKSLLTMPSPSLSPVESENAFEKFMDRFMKEQKVLEVDRERPIEPSLPPLGLFGSENEGVWIPPQSKEAVFVGELTEQVRRSPRKKRRRVYTDYDMCLPQKGSPFDPRIQEDESKERLVQTPDMTDEMDSYDERANTSKKCGLTNDSTSAKKGSKGTKRRRCSKDDRCHKKMKIKKRKYTKRKNNCRQKRKKAPGTSERRKPCKKVPGYYGVFSRSALDGSERYFSLVTIRGEKRYQGSFDTKEACAIAYDKLVLKERGKEKAKLNYPNLVSDSDMSDEDVL